jgi:hypothetical protein
LSELIFKIITVLGLVLLFFGWTSTDEPFRDGLGFMIDDLSE